MHVALLINPLPTEIDENYVVEMLTRMNHKLMTSSFFTYAFMTALDNYDNFHIIQDKSLFIGDLTSCQPCNGINIVTGNSLQGQGTDIIK